MGCAGGSSSDPLSTDSALGELPANVVKALLGSETFRLNVAFSRQIAH